MSKKPSDYPEAELRQMLDEAWETLTEAEQNEERAGRELLLGAWSGNET